MVGLREAGLSYRDIAAHTGHAATTVIRVWNQWREEGRTQRRAGIGSRNVTTARDDLYLVRMAVTDRTVSSTVLSRRWSTATGLDLSPSTVRRRLLRAGLVARMTLPWLPLSRDHQRLRLQWTRERRHWRAEWRNVVFPDESRFNMSYNDGRIRVRRNLSACILQRHKGSTPSVMVWGAIGYNMRSRLLRIECSLNINRYIREVLQSEVLPLLQATPHAIFQQTMPGHTWKGLCKPSSKDDRYHCFPGLHVRQCRPTNMSGIWSVGNLFVRVLQHLLLTLCGLAYKTAWRDIPQEDIQGSV